jgi:hypothetical protein
VKIVNSPHFSPQSQVLLMLMPNISVFSKKALELKLTDAALPELRSAVGNSERKLARLFAAYSLGTMRARGAPALPDLRRALEAEVEDTIRLEMLAAIFEMGKDALMSLDPKEKTALLDTLKGCATDSSDTRSLQRKCAALALLRLAPATPQAIAALPAAAEALLIKDWRDPRIRVELVDGDKNKAQFSVIKPEPLDPREVTLRDWARRELPEFGNALDKDYLRKNVVPALVRAYQYVLKEQSNDSEPLAKAKQEARKSMLEILGSFGTKAQVLELRDLLRRIPADPLESSDVKTEAARAYRAVGYR